MSNFPHLPLESNDTVFGPIVEAVQWRSGTIVPHLRVADEIGWLVMVDNRDCVESLVGFSTEAVNDPGITPPMDVEEIVERLGPHGRVLGRNAPFNSDQTAKGLGSQLANTPQALQPGVSAREVAVRSLPVTSMDEIYRRDQLEAGMSRTAGLLRHGFRLLGAIIGDGSSGNYAGTRRAIHKMEQGYGDHRLVMLPAPPSWQIAHERHGIAQPVPPRTLLARGGRFAMSNYMEQLGTYSSHS